MEKVAAGGTALGSVLMMGGGTGVGATGGRGEGADCACGGVGDGCGIAMVDVGAVIDVVDGRGDVIGVHGAMVGIGERRGQGDME